MIDVPNFVALCFAVFALLYLGWRLWDERHPVLVRTVEQEEDESRAALALVGQHHPSEPEDHEDPLWHVINLMHDNNAASM